MKLPTLRRINNLLQSTHQNHARRTTTATTKHLNWQLMTSTSWMAACLILREWVWTLHRHVCCRHHHNHLNQQKVWPSRYHYRQLQQPTLLLASPPHPRPRYTRRSSLRKIRKCFTSSIKHMLLQPFPCQLNITKRWIYCWMKYDNSSLHFLNVHAPCVLSIIIQHMIVKIQIRKHTRIRTSVLRSPPLLAVPSQN